jgi:acetyl-CoA synthetase
MSAPERLAAYHFYEREWDSYQQLRDAFEWEVPAQFNTTAYCCDRWADGTGRTALYYESVAGPTATVTYDDLRARSCRLANYLADSGVERGDRILVHGVQKPTTLVALLAAWRMGVVAVPTSALLGPDALRYRLRDCEPRAAVVDAAGIEAYRSLSPALRDDVCTVTTDVEAAAGDEVGFERAVAGQVDAFDPVETAADDPASIIYTSGTTGQPKGVVLAHRVALGHLPEFVTVNCNMTVNDDDVVWTPIEWTWIASVYVRLVTSLFYGLSLVAHHREKFDPEAAFEVIERYGVTQLGAPATALRMMMDVDSPHRFDVSSVRVIVSGGEAVGQPIVDWASDVFDDVAVHQAYGQTEANATIGDCTTLTERREGALGPAVPGHEVAIVDPQTAEPIDEPNQVGEIAVARAGNPVHFTEYLDKPAATAAKRANGWHLTEDLGSVDEDGYFTYEGRKDDVIISSGYRISPSEIEDALAAHEAVADAGVVGVPHDVRGEIPKAYVTVRDGYEPSEALDATLQTYVRESLAKYEYPREIEFVDALPKTPSGKLKRSALEAMGDD